MNFKTVNLFRLLRMGFAALRTGVNFFVQYVGPLSYDIAVFLDFPGDNRAAFSRLHPCEWYRGERDQKANDQACGSAFRRVDRWIDFAKKKIFFLSHKEIFMGPVMRMTCRDRVRENKQTAGGLAQ